MKKYSSIILILLTTVTLCSDELTWVDEQIEAIKPPRVGVTSNNIAKIKPPFVFLYNKKIKTKSFKKRTKTRYSTKKATKKSSKTMLSNSSSVKLHLSAIINGSALINGRWYKPNDKIYNYKISNIKLTTVLLTNGNKKLVLSTSDSKQNLKFK